MSGGCVFVSQCKTIDKRKGSGTIPAMPTEFTDPAVVPSIDPGSVEIADVDGLQAVLDGKADSAHAHDFSDLGAKPTTLSGYGITDAATAAQGAKADAALRFDAAQGLDDTQKEQARENFGGAVSPVSTAVVLAADHVLAVADNGRELTAYSPRTLTLPNYNTFPKGFRVAVNVSADMTVSGVLLNASTNTLVTVIPAGTYFGLIEREASGWRFRADNLDANPDAIVSQVNAAGDFTASHLNAFGKLVHVSASAQMTLPSGLHHVGRRFALRAVADAVVTIPGALKPLDAADASIASLSAADGLVLLEAMMDSGGALRWHAVRAASASSGADVLPVLFLTEAEGEPVNETFAVYQETGGTADSQLDFIAKLPGGQGNDITVQYTTDGARDTILVTVTGTAVKVYTRSATGASPLSTAAEIKAAIEAHATASALVGVSHHAGSDGTGVHAWGTVQLATGTGTPADGPGQLLRHGDAAPYKLYANIGNTLATWWQIPDATTVPGL